MGDQEDPMMCQPTDMKIDTPQSMQSSFPSLNPTITINKSITPAPPSLSLPTKPPEIPYIKASMSVSSGYRVVDQGIINIFITWVMIH